MGCYGIGTSRIMGIIVEMYHDDRGIVWPKEVAPYEVHLIGLDLRDEVIKKRAYEVYEALKEKGMEVLFDDREDTPAGAKFGDADLIGIPLRLVVSKRTGDKIEYKERASKETKLLELTEVLKF